MPLGNVFCRREEILLPLILHSHHRVQTISDTCAPCPLIHFCQAPLGNLRDVPFMQKISLTQVTLAVGNTYLGNLSKTTQRIFSVKEGVPPFLLREIPLKSRYFRSENSIFCLFPYIFAVFGLLYGLFGPFLTLFNTKT